MFTKEEIKFIRSLPGDKFNNYNFSSLSDDNLANIQEALLDALTSFGISYDGEPNDYGLKCENLIYKIVETV